MSFLSDGKRFPKVDGRLASAIACSFVALATPCHANGHASAFNAGSMHSSAAGAIMNEIAVLTGKGLAAGAGGKPRFYTGVLADPDSSAMVARRLASGYLDGLTAKHFSSVAAEGRTSACQTGVSGGFRARETETILGPDCKTFLAEGGNADLQHVLRDLMASVAGQPGFSWHGGQVSSEAIADVPVDVSRWGLGFHGMEAGRLAARQLEDAAITHAPDVDGGFWTWETETILEPALKPFLAQGGSAGLLDMVAAASGPGLTKHMPYVWQDPHTAAAVYPEAVIRQAFGFDGMTYDEFLAWATEDATGMTRDGVGESFTTAETETILRLVRELLAKDGDADPEDATNAGLAASLGQPLHKASWFQAWSAPG